jgi:MFS family permease
MPQSDRLLTPEFGVLTASSALYFAGPGVLNALMPLYVVDVIGGSEATAGAVMGSLAIPSLLSRPFLGRVADRHGSRRIMIAGALISVLSMVILAVFPPTLPTALASRLVLGVGGAAMFTGSAVRSIELAPPQRRGQATSLALVAIHAGLGLGPIIGLRLQNSFGYDAAWVLVGGLALASAAASTLLTRTAGSGGADKAPLINRAALLPGTVTLFGVFAFNGFVAFAALYGREVGIGDVSLVFTVLSGSVIGVRLFGGQIPDIIGPIKAGSGALVVTMVAALVVAFWARPAGIYVGAVLLAAGLSLQSPSFIPLAVAGVPDEQRGAAMATFTAFYDVANALVGPLLGLIVVGAGYPAAFSFTAVMALVALVILNTAVANRWRNLDALA